MHPSCQAPIKNTLEPILATARLCSQHSFCLQQEQLALQPALSKPQKREQRRRLFQTEILGQKGSKDFFYSADKHVLTGVPTVFGKCLAKQHRASQRATWQPVHSSLLHFNTGSKQCGQVGLPLRALTEGLSTPLLNGPLSPFSCFNGLFSTWTYVHILERVVGIFLLEQTKF